jgi:hypothetical protein
MKSTQRFVRIAPQSPLEIQPFPLRRTAMQAQGFPTDCDIKNDGRIG